MDTKYPDIHVQLTGGDSHTGAIIGSVVEALRENGVSWAEVNEFRKEAYSGDYKNVLATAMRWVSVS